MGFLFWEAHFGRITGIKIYNVMELDLAIKLGWIKTDRKVWIFEVWVNNGCYAIYDPSENKILLIY